jgi:ACT domain-containing protein
MSTFLLPTHPGALASSVAGLVKGARTYAAALFAAQERQYVAQEAVKKSDVPASALYKSRLALFNMARECEERSPSQAAELRNLAGRD